VAVTRGWDDMAAVKYQVYGKSQGDSSVPKPNIKIPKEYENEAEFLDEMRRMFADDLQADRLNREAALEDLKFVVGDQWDDITRARRESGRKPVLTVNRLPAFIAQILGSRRLNETDVKVAADSDGAVPIAQVREGLIRSIQKVSRAEGAYDNALAGAVMCGIGNFGLELAENEDDALGEQDINVYPINDHLSVLWDRAMKDPTGKDATHVFEVEVMTQRDFYQTWPWATPADVTTDYNIRGDLRMSGWVSIDDVRVVAYWRMRKRKRTLAALIDGSTVDITDEDDPITLLKIATKPDGSPVIREVMRPYAQMYICSGVDVLEGPYDLPISRVPVFRVPGWEVYVAEWKHRWGLTRFLKDPQRLHNYWRSIIAERLMQTPRAVWVSSQEAVQGREADWRSSHLSDNPLLIYNGTSGAPPQRVQPAQLEESLMGESETSAQDIKDVSNIHEANLGMPSNEVSSVAIMARQRVSDTGTIIYHDNLAKAIEEAGRVMNELIPVVYDTPRVVKIMGKEGQDYMQAINQFNNPKSIDITAGKYSITCGVGPSFATKRIEQAAAILGMSQAMPQILSLAADLIVEGQDWPSADKIANRLRNALPPGILTPQEMTPQQVQSAQQHAALQQKAQSVQDAMATANYLKTQSDALLNAARARNFAAEAANQPQKEMIEGSRAAAEITHTEYQDRLDALRIAAGK
jgi:hypothetical protein